MTSRLGDANAQLLLQRHDAIVRDAVTSHEGTEIKHTGDGIMASFHVGITGGRVCDPDTTKAVKVERRQYGTDSRPRGHQCG
jgi:class 3 adenylate cyclase